MNFKNKEIMRTTIIIVFCLILFLVGLTFAGYSQGITNSAGFIKGTSTNHVKLSGSSDMTLKSTTADRTEFGHLTVDPSGTDVYKVTIPDDSYITVKGNLSLSDTLELEASSSGMASLITEGTVTGSKAKVEQHLTQDQWQMVSSPVTAAQADVYTGIYLLDWNEPDSTWSYINTLTDPLNVTEGYFTWSESTLSSPTDVAYTGLLNTGNQAASLTYNNNAGEGHGWNLLGNPYPSALEWTSSWTTSGVDATIYIYDGSNYLTWNYNLGGFGTKSDGSIPSTQGFWVKANSSSPSVTIPNSSRTHSAQSFYKDGDGLAKNLIVVRLANNGNYDEMLLGKNEYASNKFDSEFDAYKLFGDDDLPQVYSLLGETKLSVDIFSKGSHKIPLGVRIAQDGKHSLSFEGVKDFDGAVNVYLKDKKNISISTALVNLKQNPKYTFHSKEGFEDNRFEIIFVYNEIKGGFAQMEKQGNAYIYAYEKDVFVNFQSDIPGNVSVHDILGREIHKESLTINQLNQIRINNGAGYYIVTVTSGSEKKSKKVFIN